MKNNCRLDRKYFTFFAILYGVSESKRVFSFPALVFRLHYLSRKNHNLRKADRTSLKDSRGYNFKTWFEKNGKMNYVNSVCVLIPCYSLNI